METAVPLHEQPEPSVNQCAIGFGNDPFISFVFRAIPFVIRDSDFGMLWRTPLPAHEHSRELHKRRVFDDSDHGGARYSGTFHVRGLPPAFEAFTGGDNRTISFNRCGSVARLVLANQPTNQLTNQPTNHPTTHPTT